MARSSILKTAIVASTLTALLAGCVHKGNEVPRYEVHLPDSPGSAAATLHPASEVAIQVPNADHRSIKVEIVSINDRRITSAHPVVIPAGVHVFDLRCTMNSARYRAQDERVFHGQSQWRLHANRTYTIRPKLTIDAYDNPICAATLHANL